MAEFSVLLSLYQKEKADFLRLCLDSLLSQSVSPTEVVLVEDGPLTDILYSIVDEFRRKTPFLKVVPILKNVGLGRALNEGLKHCSCELVARMDTDDITKPDRFEKQLKVFEKHLEYDLVGAWIEEFEGDISNVKTVRKLPETHSEIYQFGKNRNPMNHPVVMFRKKAVEAVGGYKHFPLFEDYYLWVRMFMNGSKAYNIQESLLSFRVSPDTFKRRGGFKYACDEVRFQIMLLKLGYINLVECFINICIRFATRIIPNNLRGWIYKNLLRK